ncbi:hypothetical protein CKA32_006051 [Geitlerinema sp. FC II]|nr:hypothetical protein CKA32_006051 [Geitlerinema sp. FC II]
MEFFRVEISLFRLHCLLKRIKQQSLRYDIASLHKVSLDFKDNIKKLFLKFF